MTEWIDVGRATRTLGLSTGEVVALVDAGTLRSRTTKFDALPTTLVSLDSIEDYLAGKSSKPEPRTFVRVAPGKFIEEF